MWVDSIRHMACTMMLVSGKWPLSVMCSLRVYSLPKEVYILLSLTTHYQMPRKGEGNVFFIQIETTFVRK